MSSTKKKVVRMMGRAVDLVYSDRPSIGQSGLEPDRSALIAHEILKKLKALAIKDPNNRFGIYLARLQLRLLKDLRAEKS